jgi:hypothetical protein
VRHGTHHHGRSRLTVTALSGDRWIISGKVDALTVTSDPLTRDTAETYIRRLCPPELAERIIRPRDPEATRTDIVCQGAPGGWSIKTADGHRCSQVLDDATARRYCGRLGIAFPGDRLATR